MCSCTIWPPTLPRPWGPQQQQQQAPVSSSRGTSSDPSARKPGRTRPRPAALADAAAGASGNWGPRLTRRRPAAPQRRQQPSRRRLLARQAERMLAVAPASATRRGCALRHGRSGSSPRRRQPRAPARRAAGRRWRSAARAPGAGGALGSCACSRAWHVTRSRSRWISSSRRQHRRPQGWQQPHQQPPRAAGGGGGARLPARVPRRRRPRRLPPPPPRQPAAAAGAAPSCTSQSYCSGWRRGRRGCLRGGVRPWPPA
jgi:hypothetical protein